MKTLIDHINEALKIGKNLSKFSTYSCQPKTKNELVKIINNRITENGNNCDLNDIDTSLITDMSGLFCRQGRSGFNGDISKWNVSNVESMADMFNKSAFNGDISNWDVSKVRYMGWMFAYSNFDGDLSKWNVDNNCMTGNMFYECPIKNEHKPLLLQLL